MKLFRVKGWQLEVSEETWGLTAFKDILDRDKNKEKEHAMKELLYIWFFCDIKSDYLSMPESIRHTEIKKDIGLDEDWEKDELIEAGIRQFMKFDSPIARLYRQTLSAVQAVGEYLENAEALLKERDKYDKPVNDISKITGAISKIPKMMGDLKIAYKEVVKEQEDTENKKKGSRTFNVFEEGLNID